MSTADWQTEAATVTEPGVRFSSHLVISGQILAWSVTTRVWASQGSMGRDKAAIESQGKGHAAMTSMSFTCLTFLYCFGCIASGRDCFRMGTRTLSPACEVHQQ